MAELEKLNREGMAMLIVTHDSNVASRCDRIIYLLDGRICGELMLGKVTGRLERQRTDLVNNWLIKMG